ncbi:response regulator transcription factor [Rhodanobacter sp. DHB23]|uniref:response regulator transcription factor n=1 Tax=Rhodanobacter sp. DHB23 TaxID=2775923 RepID=UPI00177A9612|nr:response regulator transcription factor [Rhodanobacter sp. DHB23]MBD8871683.1 response regulator transcription factor [Rhodanobacter sp. DHB23]
MRIVICDDHPVVVMGVKAILQENGFQVVGEAHGGQQLLDLLETLSCDLVVTDFSMPSDSHRDDGLPMLRRLREAWPELPVIVLTMINNTALLHGMLKLGVRGVVDKTGMTTELLRAIRAVSAGRSFVSAGTHGVNVQVPEVVDGSTAMAALSVREAEVARLYARGLSVTQIAGAVQRSVKTVSKQKNDAMRKLGLESNRELYDFARANGLLS